MRKQVYALCFLLLTSCGSKGITPHNEPFYCNAPTKTPTDDYAKITGNLQKDETNSWNYTFFSNKLTDYGFYGILDNNTHVYQNMKKVTALSEISSTLEVTAFFSTKEKSEDAHWLKLVHAPIAENISYLFIGEITDEFKNMHCYQGDAFE